MKSTRPGRQAKIQIVTRPGCSYCYAAKALLHSHNLNFDELDLQHNDKQAHELLVCSGGRTLPQIFINNQAIGGFNELKELFNRYDHNLEQLTHFNEDNLMSNITVYRHPLSGNAHRVQLFLSILDLDANFVDVDLLKGEQKTPEFLQKNIFGQVPVLEDGGKTIADSNAILVYLASQYDLDHTWLPIEPAQAAEVQRFLAVAAGPVAAGPATARLINLFNAPLDHNKAIENSHQLFTTLDKHLEGRDWLATDNPTIADLANYSYIAHAPEGGISLVNYPNIRAWLQRVESLQGFIPMQASAIGLAA